MIPFEILRPTYNVSDNSLVLEESEEIIIFAESWQPKTRIRNTETGAVYTTLRADILADQDVRATDLIKWPQGLTPEEFAIRGRHLTILYYYPAPDANQNVHHIEIEA
ncbi:hypothetical protein AB3N59_20355 (plasmid) [Leptospira sp. WS92.C1]